MPITYTVDLEGGVIRIRATEPVTADDLAEYFRSSRLDPRVLRDHHRWLDARGVRTVPTTAELASIARSLSQSDSVPLGRIAVLADSDLTHGVARMFGGFAGMGQKLQVFQGEEAARDWIERGILIGDR